MLGFIRSIKTKHLMSRRVKALVDAVLAKIIARAARTITN
jgi:hypothetical protein